MCVCAILAFMSVSGVFMSVSVHAHVCWCVYVCVVYECMYGRYFVYSVLDLGQQ